MRNSKSVRSVLLISALVLTQGCSTQPVRRDGGAQREVASDFALDYLPKSDNSFDLSSVANKSTYYDYMSSTIAPEMKKLANSGRREANENALSDGLGVRVQLDSHNYNFHVNFPEKGQGGRSYGWTDGAVGDWTDKMYLDRLYEFARERHSSEMNTFYQTIIQLLGACNPSGISTMSRNAQRIVTNFLAIYTAEHYRAMNGLLNWDDALFQTTMLAAFHGGQSTLTKFYVGKFTSQSYEQQPGVYRGPTQGTPKRAELDDYWQYSANPNSTGSGINETRRDFEKMGDVITKYESTVAHNSTLESIQSVVGNGPNVIEGISRYFTQGRSSDVSGTNKLGVDVAAFLVQVNADADKITAWEEGGE